MQAHKPSTPRPDADYGPLNTPRMFRRATGAHAIMLSLLLVDIANGVLCVLLGTILLPLSAFILQKGYAFLHVSLALDIGILISLAALGIGILADKASQGAGVGCACGVVIVVGLVLGILRLLSVGWLTTPAPLPPLPHELTLNPWLSPLPAVGAVIAAGLVLIIHLIVIHLYRVSLESQRQTFMRAHPDGDAWSILEAAYRHLHQSLARFNPSPLPTLKTPPTFQYYRASESVTNPERKLYWVGNDLVIPLELISAKQEVAEVLLPYLARLLYDYNSPEIRHVTMLLQCARHSRENAIARRLLAWPLHIAKSCEDRWVTLDKERTLDRDRFAYLLGEGRRLRKQLQRQLKLIEDRGEEDNAIPSFTERIDQLLSLARREQRQVRHLLAQLPARPSNPGASPATNATQTQAVPPVIQPGTQGTPEITEPEEDVSGEPTRPDPFKAKKVNWGKAKE
jgi:hypothetical protein